MRVKLEIRLQTSRNQESHVSKNCGSQTHGEPRKDMVDLPPSGNVGGRFGGMFYERHFLGEVGARHQGSILAAGKAMMHPGWIFVAGGADT